MTLRSHCALVALSILATAALAATSADARPGQGRGQRPQPTAPVVEILPQAETLTAEIPTAELPEAIAVDRPVTAAPTTERQNLPPGLQRQVDIGRGLPSGLQHQVDSGRGLPPGLQRGR